MAEITGAQYKNYTLKTAGADKFVDGTKIDVDVVDCRVTVGITQGALDSRKTFVLEVADGSTLETELLKALKALVQG